MLDAHRQAHHAFAHTRLGQFGLEQESVGADDAFVAGQAPEDLDAVTGTAAVNVASIATTGSQTYTGLVTLTASATLAGTTPTFTAGVAGGGRNLTLNFSGTTTIDGSKFTGIGDLATVISAGTFSDRRPLSKLSLGET